MASTEFKTTIKSDVREIKGYCSIKFTGRSPVALIKAPGSTGAPISKISQLDDEDNNGIMNNYASFEQSFFKTDGSFLLANNPALYENPLVGYISNNIITSSFNVLVETLSSTDVIHKGMSYYFDENYPVDGYFVVKFDNNGVISYKTYYFTDNDKNYILFTDYIDDVGIVKYIWLYGTSFSRTDRRIRIKGILSGINAVYKDDDLITMNINEEVDINNETFPTSDCSIVLNNYDGKFDILNDDGLSKYLIGGTLVEPYIGCVTENGNVEYEKMGVFYLTDWSNNNDITTTINAENIISKLASIQNFAYRGSSFADYFNYVGLLATIQSTITYTADGALIKDISATEYLQYMLISANAYLSINRLGQIVIKDIDTTVDDVYSLSNFSEFPKIENSTRISKVVVNREVAIGFEGVDAVEFFNSTITYNPNGNTVYYLSYDTGYLILNNSDIVVTGGTLVRATYGFKSIEVIVSATSDFNLSISGYKLRETIIQSYVAEDTTVTNGQTLTINFLTDTMGTLSIEEIANNVLSNYKNYKITTQGQQDPSIVAGSLIGIETKNGYKNIIVNKNNFIFDGGLKGSIEGVGD